MQLLLQKKAYEAYKTAIVVTGEQDVIVQDGKVVMLSNGSPLLTKVTGAGCLLGGSYCRILIQRYKTRYRCVD